MQFRILGPIELWNGKRIDLGGPKQRTLMAALLLGSGQVQSIHSLVDILWDDSPPSSAHNLVTLYVHHLRKRLGPDAAADLRTSPPGYLLRTEDHALDLHVFERLVVQGRKAAAEGDHRLAAARLREGLSLWRGPALAGVESAVLDRSHLLRIEEARLTALEHLMDSELALGNRADVISALRTHIEQHPYRERMHHQLMLALYLSGRRVEALDVYSKVRAVLSEEIGIDPGPQLQQLMQSILADGVPTDPAETIRGVADAGEITVRRPIPARLGPPLMQTPAPPRQLFGRDAERGVIRNRLRPSSAEWTAGAQVITITGLPGSGKSALLADCARELRASYPDGQLYADLEATPVADVLADFLLALGVAREDLPSDVSRRAGLFRSLTHELRLLVLLDNAVSEQQVRPLVPTSPGSAELICCDRCLPALENTHTVKLEPLSMSAGLGMLQDLLGHCLEAERHAAEDIVTFCDGLPLAIRTIAARLAGHSLPLRRMAMCLREPNRRLDEMQAGDLDVRARLTRAYSQLDGAAQRLLHQSATVPADKLTFCRLSRLAGEYASFAIDELVRFHFLQVSEVHEMYEQLELVRAFAKSQATPLAEAEVAR